MAEQRGRRSLLDLLLGAGFLGFFASIIYPVLRYLKPLAPQESAGALRLTREGLGRLEKEHSPILRQGPRRILLSDDPEQRLRAMAAPCTHDGCTAQDVPGASRS